MFKAKDPKTYIQVKTSLINNGTQIIVVCTDITRVKEVEKEFQNIRSQFFSSVAHELRTPLNSILPILKMVLEILAKSKDPQDPRIERLLKVVHSSTIHLQNVIEDALDVTRLANNKFEIFKENFNLKNAVNEVFEVMKFQIEEKGLEFKLDFSEFIPTSVFSDSKRIK